MKKVQMLFLKSISDQTTMKQITNSTNSIRLLYFLNIILVWVSHTPKQNWNVIIYFLLSFMHMLLFLVRVETRNSNKWKTCYSKAWSIKMNTQLLEWRFLFAITQMHNKLGRYASMISKHISKW